MIVYSLDYVIESRLVSSVRISWVVVLMLEYR